MLNTFHTSTANFHLSIIITPLILYIIVTRDTTVAIGKYSVTDRVPAISKVVDAANVTNFVGFRDLFYVCVA